MMKISPKIISNVCLTAHPEGCKLLVKNQIDYIKSQSKIKGPKNVVVLGCSGGYGLALRIALTYGSGSKVLGVSFERAGTESKIGSVGYYNNKAFSEFAKEDGIEELTLNNDVFTNEGKAETMEHIKSFFKGEKVDAVFYSIASPVRTDPNTGIIYKSVLKPIGSSFTGQSVDIFSSTLKDVTVEPASEEEVIATQKVMGGEDWELWTKALLKENLLNKGAYCVASSYIGPKVTYPIYREGTIGKAKEHLENTASKLNDLLKGIDAKAFVSVNKAVVTRASSVIPVLSLYTILMFKILKQNGWHEDCIHQEYRLIKKLYENDTVETDEKGRVRVDNLEMQDEVQEAVMKAWDGLTQDNLLDRSDLVEVRRNFMQLHGFDFDGIDYDKEVDIL